MEELNIEFKLRKDFDSLIKVIREEVKRINKNKSWTHEKISVNYTRQHYIF